MLRFCRRVDDTTSEEEKLRQLLKRLSHNLFSGIAATPPTTVLVFIPECKRPETLHCGRTFQFPFHRLHEVIPSLSNTVVIPSVPDVIRNVFQNVLARLISQLTDIDTKRAAQEELRAVLDSMTPAVQQHTSTTPAYPSACPSTCPTRNVFFS